jgi:hypothetical protein
MSLSLRPDGRARHIATRTANPRRPFGFFARRMRFFRLRMKNALFDIDEAIARLYSGAPIV